MVEIKEDSLQRDMKDLRELFQTYLDRLQHQSQGLCTSIKILKDSLPNNKLGREEIAPPLQFCIHQLNALTSTIKVLFETIFENQFRQINEAVKCGEFQDLPKYLRSIKTTLVKIEGQDLVGQFHIQIEKVLQKIKIRLMIQDKYRLCTNFVPLLEHGMIGIKDMAETGLENLADQCLHYVLCVQYALEKSETG